MITNCRNPPSLSQQVEDSFVFTTSANANSNGEAPQKSNLEVRVKDMGIGMCAVTKMQASPKTRPFFSTEVDVNRGVPVEDLLMIL